MNQVYDKEAVGRRIKSIRIDVGLDQKTLADMSGVQINSIAQYELGNTVMGFDKACALADALGCSLDELACRTGRYGD